MGYPEAQYTINEIKNLINNLYTWITGWFMGHGTQTFTSDGTFTVPAGVTKIWVTSAGGGGGGACGDYNFTYRGGGGGGGACVCKKPFGVTPGQEIAITIGAGGAGGNTYNTDGKSGGSTVIGSLITLPGGSGGYYQCTGGDGGDGAGGGGAGGYKDSGANYITAKGGSGYIYGQNALRPRYDSSTLAAGNGGGSCVGASGGNGFNIGGGGGGGSVGAGGNGGSISPNRLSTAGVYGGGGGGGVYATPYNYVSGADGGSGIVIIEW